MKTIAKIYFFVFLTAFVLMLVFGLLGITPMPEAEFICIAVVVIPGGFLIIMLALMKYRVKQKEEEEQIQFEQSV